MTEENRANEPPRQTQPTDVVFGVSESRMIVAIQADGRIVVNPDVTSEMAALHFVRTVVAPNRHLPTLDLSFGPLQVLVINTVTGVAVLGPAAIPDAAAQTFAANVTKLLQQLYPPLPPKAEAPGTPDPKKPGPWPADSKPERASAGRRAN